MAALIDMVLQGDETTEIAASLVPRERLAEVWPACAPHLAEALERSGGDYALDDVLALILSGQWLLWVATRPGEVLTAAVTSLIDYPRKRVLHIEAAGGATGEGVAALWPLLLEWARVTGCARIGCQARRGWMRSPLRPEGLQHTHDVVSFDVTGA